VGGANKPESTHIVSDHRISADSIRACFFQWLSDGHAKQYPPQVIISCIDKVSEYVVRKKRSSIGIWECTQPNSFYPLYKRLANAKLFRITDRNTHKVFVEAGELYLRFLEEKPFTLKKNAVACVEPEKVKSEIGPKQDESNINPEEVIDWLITQPNANGTLYLENVVRQYMGMLRTTPAKLEITDIEELGVVFKCHTPSELNKYWEICKAAPNYKQVNRRTSGMFSAALNCYERYLQHLEDNINDEEAIIKKDNQQVSEIINANDTITTELTRNVDFNHPELCAYTKPLSCYIKGQPVVPIRWNWSQLLVAITERFIVDEYKNLDSLSSTFLYGSNVFFLDQKPQFGTCSKLSNGMWIYTNYNSQTVVTIIRNLCEHCGVDLDDVAITYKLKRNSPDQAVPTDSQSIQMMSEIQFKPKIDSSLIERLTDILSTNFSNGFRLDSPIEMMRFRSSAASSFGDRLTLSDDNLKAYITACGPSFEGKVYVVSAEVQERIKEIIDDYFANGAQVVFYSEFYAKNEKWLFGASIISEGMLIEILRSLFPESSFTRTYFGNLSESISVVLANEILRVWSDEALNTYDQLAERLTYIPLDRIKYELGQNGDFIWNSVGTFSHISQIEINEEEVENICAVAIQECNNRGYVSITDLPFGEIVERNYKLSITAVHNAVYRVCLADKFDKKGKIVTRKGDVLDALTIMKEHCRTIDKCSLDDLQEFERELTGEIHRWIPMEAGNSILIRIDKDTYVADRYVQFDVDRIDKVIDLMVRDRHHLPLKAFTTFSTFPDCGQAWNLFLLESYCRRFSRKFRFDALSVNSRNAGAVIRASCVMNYMEIMADAVANSETPLTETSAGRFLFENGYIGRSSTVRIAEILHDARAKREGGD